MSKAILQNRSTKRRTSFHKQSLGGVANLMHRYELLLKEQQKKEQMKSNCFQLANLLPRVQHSLQKFWQKIMPTSIRGSCNEVQTFLQLTNKDQQTKTTEDRKKITKFINILSLQSNLKDYLKESQKCICFIYTKDTIQMILESQIISKLISSQCLSFNVCLLYEGEDSRNRDILQQIYSNCRQLWEQQQNKCKLVDITKRSLNTSRSGCGVTNSCQRFCSQTKQKKSVQKSSIQFPLIVPFSRGLFDEIIMYKPYSLKNCRLDLINQVFHQRSLLQNEVKQRVRQKLNNQTKKDQQSSLQQQMDSNHKIQISQYKDHI